MTSSPASHHFASLIRLSWAVAGLATAIAFADLILDFLPNWQTLLALAIAALGIVNVIWLMRLRRRRPFSELPEPLTMRPRSRRYRFFNNLAIFIGAAVVITAALLDVSYVFIWLFLIVFALAGAAYEVKIARRS